jgi:tetratricopeptide (TPR) repeat protein
MRKSTKVTTALNIEAEQSIEKKGKFKRSGHLTDQILKYNYKAVQPSLFDALLDETKKQIEGAGVEITQIVEGIKLSPAETKLIDCFCKLLHYNSQTSEPNKGDYYSGLGYDLVTYGGEKTPAPKIAFTIYELAKEYKGGDKISGKDIENIKQIVTDLDNKKFLLSYVETTATKNGRIERKIEDFKKLIHIVKLSQTEYSKDNIELSKKEETIILLNPIFRRQIDSKFILYPNDILRRTIIAYGSHNLSEIALRLRDYLMRELSSKHFSPEITLDRLYYFLAEKWMRESRKKKIKEYIDKAIETVKALGLLQSYEIKTASTGEQKIVFYLNKDWE